MYKLKICLLFYNNLDMFIFKPSGQQMMPGMDPLRQGKNISITL